MAAKLTRKQFVQRKTDGVRLEAQSCQAVHRAGSKQGIGKSFLVCDEHPGFHNLRRRLLRISAVGDEHGGSRTNEEPAIASGESAQIAHIRGTGHEHAVDAAGA